MRRRVKERICSLKEEWQNQSIYAELIREQMVLRLGLLKEERQKILEYKKKCLPVEKMRETKNKTKL